MTCMYLIIFSTDKSMAEPVSKIPICSSEVVQVDAGMSKIWDSSANRRGRKISQAIPGVVILHKINMVHLDQQRMATLRIKATWGSPRCHNFELQGTGMQLCVVARPDKVNLIHGFLLSHVLQTLIPAKWALAACATPFSTLAHHWMWHHGV